MFMYFLEIGKIFKRITLCAETNKIYIEYGCNYLKNYIPSFILILILIITL